MRISLGRNLGPLALVIAGISVMGVVAGCDDVEKAPEAAPAASTAPARIEEPQSEEPQSEEPVGNATLVAITDGDTIKTSEGRVRIIGIDTPEEGECGFEQSSAALAALLKPGDSLILESPEATDDEDQYGRLLRYVSTVDGLDIGLMQLEAGHAVARYDSTDGYAHHPREEQYREAQQATLDADGNVIATYCLTQVAPAPDPAEAVDEWWLQYGSCSQLKKNAVGHPTGPFNRDNPAEVDIYNWFAYGTGHRGDGDGDGLACE